MQSDSAKRTYRGCVSAKSQVGIAFIELSLIALNHWFHRLFSSLPVLLVVFGELETLQIARLSTNLIH